MAGNFWQSSHCQQWLFDRQEILRGRSYDLKNINEEEYQKIMIFFANFIQAFGVDLGARQQVIATATVYFKRFYARKSFKCIDPFLLAPTCVVLALKVEEQIYLNVTNKLSPTLTKLFQKRYPYIKQDMQLLINKTSQLIYEAEFFLLEMMDCCLIVYHPYRPLNQFIQDITARDLRVDNTNLTSLSWEICNDSLRTDVSLMYPPFQIALGCLHIASVVCGRDLKTWFAELAVDMDKIFEVIQYIMNLYRLLNGFDEREQMPSLLAKIDKPQTHP